MKIQEIITEDSPQDNFNKIVSKLGNQFVSMPAVKYVLPPGKEVGGKIIAVSTKIGQMSDDSANRIVVLASINGIHIPFYLSTGAAGKKTVPSGKWYPIFGITGNGDWLNKGPEPDINAFYGSQKLKSVADWLNSNIGDIRYFDEVDPRGKIMPMLTGIAKSWDTINKDLSPAPSHKDFAHLKKNIDATLLRIGEQPFYDKNAKVEKTTSNPTPAPEPISNVPKPSAEPVKGQLVLT